MQSQTSSRNDQICSSACEAQPGRSNPKTRLGLNFDLFPRDEFSTPAHRVGVTANHTLSLYLPLSHYVFAMD